MGRYRIPILSVSYRRF